MPRVTNPPSILQHLGFGITDVLVLQESCVPHARRQEVSKSKILEPEIHPAGSVKLTTVVVDAEA